jgi:hypothetical protein
VSAERPDDTAEDSMLEAGTSQTVSLCTVIPATDKLVVIAMIMILEIAISQAVLSEGLSTGNLLHIWPRLYDILTLEVKFSASPSLKVFYDKGMYILLILREANHSRSSRGSRMPPCLASTNQTHSALAYPDCPSFCRAKVNFS